MSFSERFNEVRAGFAPSFWVANFTELFERFAYYGTLAVLAIYLTEQMHFSKQLAGSIMGTFGFVVWFLPLLGGTLADRFGFRRALMFAYLVMTLGYFLLGSLSAPWMQGLRMALGDKWLVMAVLLIPALGPAVVKPCVAGTTARTSTENVRSIGYAIYYTIVNIGGTIGPIVAWLVRKRLGWGIENVFRVSALSVFLMFFVTLLFFREPARADDEQVSSVGTALKNMVLVLGNFRFVLFLLIFSSFYIVFWQGLITAPIYFRSYVNANADVDLVQSIEGLAIIAFQILVSYLTRKIPAFPAMTLGLVISSLSWLVLLFMSSITGLGVAYLILSIGEMIQSARYYEYVSRLAPPGQQGLYMGYSFLPVAIGSIVAGTLGGFLLHEFGDVLHRPRQMWLVVTGIGLLGAIAMVIYNQVFKPDEPTAAAQAG